MQSKNLSQTELALFINKHYDPLSIAESIAKHEYFMSEPLIAVRNGDSYRVIEGNRRLTALKGLADTSMRNEFARENKGWSKLPPSKLPPLLPVLVVDDESRVAPLLGFRHISGIEPWDPHAQARYVARLVSEEGRSLDYVADLVGRSATEVKAMYRDYDILEQAEHEFGIDTSKARAAFGIFTNAMARRGIQQYIGAKAPRFTDPERFPLPDDHKQHVERLIRWIFGGTRGEGKVISDSRQLGDLAKALSNPLATQALESSNNLSDALEAMADTVDQFLTSTSRVRRELRRIVALNSDEIPERLWGELDGELAQYLEIISERRKGVGS